MCTQLTQQICSNVAGILFPNVAYMLPQNLKWKPLSVYLQRCIDNTVMLQKDVKAT